MQVKLKELLSKLPPKETQALILHYGVYEFLPPFTPKQIGGLWGVSEKKVNQIEKRAICYLQKILNTRGIGPGKINIYDHDIRENWIPENEKKIWRRLIPNISFAEETESYIKNILSSEAWSPYDAKEIKKMLSLADYHIRAFMNKAMPSVFADLFNAPIECLELSTRAIRILKQAHICKIKNLFPLEKLVCLNGMGAKSNWEIICLLWKIIEARSRNVKFKKK